MTGSRDARLDVLRGLCLLSMVCGHLAMGRWPDVLTHPLVVVDGAAGFVLLSGVVLGRAQRKRPHLVSPLRRARKIWLAHVVLVLVALVVKDVTGEPWFVPDVGELGGWLAGTAQVGLLLAQPDWFAVLPFYVFALLLAPLLVLALRHGRARYLALVSVAVYVASLLTGRWNPATTHGDGTWDWGGWQLLLVMGFVAGWHWATLVRWGYEPAVRRVLLAVGAAAVVTTVVIGQTISFEAYVAGFNKLEVNPGVPLLVLVLAAPAYWVAGRLPMTLAAFLARTGANSLRGFVALTALQFVLFAFWPERPVALSLLAIAAVLAVTWLGPRRSGRTVGIDLRARLSLWPAAVTP